MNILDKIIAHKKAEVALAKRKVSVDQLQKSAGYNRETVSLVNSLLKGNTSGIIAEFKRKSPSKGILNANATAEDIVAQYEAAGAAASSVLTDTEFFGGSQSDLIAARKHVKIPLLRKDFMIDEYQFYEARSWGADVILLIASILSPQEVKNFSRLAKSLDLEVLLELHDESELGHVNELVDMIGINNRNLKTFDVDTEQSIRMAEKLGNEKIKIAESGISDIKTLQLFRDHGFHGFLVGEAFMKTSNPGLACRDFIQSVQLK